MRRNALLTAMVAAVTLPAGIGAEAVAASPTPLVTSISASSGPLTGGEHLTVHGTGFMNVHKVLFGGAPAHLVRAGATTVTVLVPRHKAGRVDVRVVTAAGESKVVRADRFTFVAPPMVSALDPATGPVSGGTRVTLKGKGFGHVKAVMFGKAKGTHLHVASGKALSVTAPTHSAGVVDVRVLTSYGTSKSVKADHFDYVGPVLVTPPVAPPLIPGPPLTPGPPALTIGPVALPPTAAGFAYPPVTLTATGGTPPYRWSAQLLPGGLTISAAGTISGTTLATPGLKAVQLTVTDAAASTTTVSTHLTVAPYATGQLYAFGRNRSGTLGDGTTVEHDTAAVVPGMTGVVSVCGNYNDTFAATADGGLWAWGDDTDGELGDGVTTQQNMPRTSPVQLSGVTGVTAVACGGETGYALTAAGTVYSWGIGDQGQLGDNTTARRVPVQIAGLTSVVAIAAASTTGYAVKSDGTVWAWGHGAEGQLGDGSTTASRSAPGQVPGLTDVVSIAASTQGAYALHADGHVSTWGGSSAFYPLGDGGTSPRLSPSLIPELSGITQVASGGPTSYAVQDDGTLWAWGYNSGGQVGDGSTDTRRSPVRVFGLTTVQAVAASSTEAYAITAGGTVWGWGWWTIGTSGIGGPAPMPAAVVPVQATWFTSIVSFGNGGPDTFLVKRAHAIVGPPPVEPPPVS